MTRQMARTAVTLDTGVDMMGEELLPSPCATCTHAAATAAAGAGGGMLDSGGDARLHGYGGGGEEGGGAAAAALGEGDMSWQTKMAMRHAAAIAQRHQEAVDAIMLEKAERRRAEAAMVAAKEAAQKHAAAEAYVTGHGVKSHLNRFGMRQTFAEVHEEERGWRACHDTQLTPLPLPFPLPFPLSCKAHATTP